jgi:hypothetical protein
MLLNMPKHEILGNFFLSQPKPRFLYFLLVDRSTFFKLCILKKGITRWRSGLGVLDEPCSARSAERPARLHRMDTVPAYVDWRACTATLLSGLS